jgi:di/tripeptidase
MNPKARKEEAAWMKKVVARRQKEYEKAKADYHKAGEEAKAKGPYSYEAESKYPEARYRYEKKGEILRQAKKALQNLIPH